MSKNNDSLQAKPKHRYGILRKIPGAVLLFLLAVILLVFGVILGVYSEWFQDNLRERLVIMLNTDPDTELRIGSFRLKFPFDLNVSDVLVISHGDTLVEAGNLSAEVSLLPILKGEIGLKEAELKNARYQIGAMDSASCMVFRGNDIKIGKSTIGLSPLDVNVSEVYLDKLGVNMWINPADTFPKTPSTEPSPLNIHVEKISYNDLSFRMQLMPSIYDLQTSIAEGNIEKVDVDLLKQNVSISSFNGNKLNAEYLLPNEEQLENTLVVVSEATESSLPWTIEIGDIDFTDSQALYTTSGLLPEPGLDFGYLEFENLNLKINNFFNRASEVILPFDVSGEERCGLNLNASGTLAIDSLGLEFKDFLVRTATGTDLAANAYMGTVTPLTDAITPLSVNVKGDIGTDDVKTMFPAFKPYLAAFKKNYKIRTDINIEGTAGDLDIKKLSLDVSRHFRIAAYGNINNVFDPKDLGGKINLDASITDVSHWTTALLSGTGVQIPSMSLKGSAVFSHDNYKADFVALTQKGRLALNGSFNGNAEKYNLDMTASGFPVSAFMPKMGIGPVTADIKASGAGFDLFKTTTHTDVDVHIASIEYLTKTYSDINLKLNIADTHADIILDSFNDALDLHLNAKGEIEDDKYVWLVDFNSKDLNLAELGLSKEEASVSGDLLLKADFSKTFKDIDANLKINSLSYNTSESDFTIDNSRLILSTTDTLTNFTAQNRDLFAFYSTPLPLDSIMERVNRVTAILDNDLKERKIDIPELQKAIMPFSLDVEGGEDNIVGEMLAQSDVHFNRFTVLAGNDSSLYLDAKLLGLRTATMKLDTISFDIRQVGDRLNYYASVNNRPGTFDQWAHVYVDGFFEKGKLGIDLLQKDIKNKVGFKLGATLALNPDTTMTLHFEPYQPIINYRQWDINHDNFVSFDFKHKHLDANLKMKSDVSRIALYTEHAEEQDETKHGSDEDLILQLFDIQLQDWIALDPFAPPIKGNLSAGVRVNWEDNSLNGKGTVELTDLYYGKEKVGDFDVDVTLFTDTDGHIHTEADAWINGAKTLALSGILNDDNLEDPFNLDFKMIHLPLSVVNPFLTGTAKLSGSLNGSLDIKGNSTQPKLNGYLAFEDANVNVIMLGSSLMLNADTIPVRDNLVKFDNFTIKAANNNPLTINGDVNIKDVTSPQLDLKLAADNMQLVNTDRAKNGAEIYGKAFVSLNATARGNLKVLNVNANASLLPGTNVTYVLAGGATALESQSAGSMVKFVNFADTAAVAAADSIKIEGMILNLNANLNINTGTIINVDLGTNAQDRVQLQGSGNFNYVSSPVGDGRLTGRYTFSGGFIKYSPPLISNINFGFTEGSYVAFNGNLANPQLNIKAVEQMRANVSQAGQNSRLIYFDIILSVTGSLENINVAFDLETDDDVTVANELASMSPTQRASEAMNLLLYNTYTGGSTKATSNLNGNPLFSFLTNSVNSWLANNVRGVDLSIGVDQYDQTTNGVSSTTTSYSYRVSKTLFNDRVKIIVGGSYSDDPNEEGSVAENLINDISVEYFLNNARTMYVRLFRHTGYESILEGEITQTGVGFVYRKRIGKIIDMFRPNRHRHHITHEAEKGALENENKSEEPEHDNLQKADAIKENEDKQPK